ncbi:hypothetical protein ASD11_12780 [Aeromicrobium sp. Root495]|uniref:polysaccharide pyruvyl transferase family protein n=1 Tax=Aeromicrobium sp. Root495 TaxID=1736550 RepID=UPI0006FE39C5|nr:polysaccharide pyruvyl transferase family protein [Aeromicrobium sp. Root495]KQY60324.1 hypothetical protein ASD11_12780 [Aeromicrobium sp. Root495]
MTSSAPNNPRILVRSSIAPHESVGPEAAHARKSMGTFAGNVGNLLFMDAVYRTVNTNDATVVADALTTEGRRMTQAHIDRINDEFDLFVVPLANAFRESFIGVLNRFSDVIEKLTIPVVVTGIGAQTRFDWEDDFASPELKEASSRFVRAVLDRSASIGVRGELSAEFLGKLGFGDDVVEVIGCPSMYADGRTPIIEKKVAGLTSESPIALTITPRVEGAVDLMDRTADAYPKMIYVPQENRELALLLWGERVGGMPEGFPRDTDHRLFREDRIRFPLDAPGWKALLREQEFVFGGRIHGTIAAITAGTPAVLLAHDHRTRELAEYHGIPWVQTQTLAPDLEAGRLHDEADFSTLNARRDETFERWVSFLDRNGVPHVHTPGRENPAYAEQIALRSPMPPVGPITSAGPEQLVSRLRWLRQGMDGDQLRPVRAYHAQFQPAGSGIHSVNHHISTLTSQQKGQAKELARLQKLAAGQSAQIERLTSLVESRSGGWFRRTAVALRRRAGAVKRRLARG